MENGLSINLEEKSFAIDSKGLVTGRIRFLVDQNAFPDSEWNDFVLIILEWWLQSVISLSLDSEGTAELRFMDGPFYVTVKREGNEMALDFIDNMNHNTMFQASCSFDSFKNMIINTAAKAIKEVKFQKWESEDAQKLNNTLQRAGSIA